MPERAVVQVGFAAAVASSPAHGFPVGLQNAQGRNQTDAKAPHRGPSAGFGADGRFIELTLRQRDGAVFDVYAPGDNRELGNQIARAISVVTR